MMRYPYGHGTWPMHDWGFGLEILAFVFLAIFLIILYRNYLKSTRAEAPPSALDVAKMRLAKGEITPQEFTAMKDHL
ncbi:MAG: SHOCT domain-containing protein [Syntrophomonadaceae bacterium]|nr:SHOCT domain-containing protein [Syntrophomonadaceae bacterium]